ncbi:glyoxalase [Flavobacterium alkalisoli]|uniref:Glyoxalase n=1 Tax=Flavobacterium alkalisoli TaxID=2602769 RepID=A0A5B9FS82_9FLAO|nr:glyoxalase [Flavobacterium alkalisoli]QEE49880.1 glyoxalase [Flavobacterium alkalisoli]
MLFEHDNIVKSGIFITFSGNCKEALMLYQTCFGGVLHLETFDQELHGYSEKPVIRGSLVSDSIIIHGSDLVHEEGRKIGNYLSVFLPCKDPVHRDTLIAKLKSVAANPGTSDDVDQQLIEVIDAFDVRWVLSVK